MRSTVYPEPDRTAKDKLYPPRPRIADEPIKVLCRSLLVKLGMNIVAQRMGYPYNNMPNCYHLLYSTRVFDKYFTWKQHSF